MLFAIASLCLFVVAPLATPTATLADSSSNSSTISTLLPPLGGAFVARATSGIITDAYVPFSSTLRITRAATLSPATRRHQLGLINEVMQNSTIVFTIESHVYISARFLRFFNVIFVDGYAAFRLVYRQMTESAFDYTGLYTIVLTESSRYQYDMIRRILEDCWRLQIVNVVVLVAIHPRARTAVYTYFPFTRFHCEAVAPVLHNYYVADGFLWQTAFFPPKIVNLWGCPLRVATYVLAPFMLLQRLGAGDRRQYAMDGIDGITARVLAQRMNYTPIVETTPVGRGEIFKNGSATGAYQLVLSGAVNMTIGAIAFSAERHYRIMSPSTPYYQAPLHFAVPKGRNYTAFETLFLPLGSDIWTGTVVVFALTAGLFAVLRRIGDRCLAFVVGPTNRTPFVNMMAVYMGSFLTDAIPERNFARFVLMVWTLGCLVLRNAYQGALFKHLQTQRMVAPLERLDDLIAANYSLRMHRPLFSLFDGMPKVAKYLAPTADENNIRDFQQLTAHPHARDVFLTTKLATGYYNSMHRNRTVQLSREQLFFVPMVIYFRKHSCLTAPVNDQINLYLVSGLINQWLKNFYDERSLSDASSVSGAYRTLCLEQVSGVFQMCAYMLGLAALALAVEMLAPRSRRVRALLAAI